MASESRTKGRELKGAPSEHGTDVELPGQIFGRRRPQYFASHHLSNGPPLLLDHGTNSYTFGSSWAAMASLHHEMITVVMFLLE